MEAANPSETSVHFYQ